MKKIISAAAALAAVGALTISAYAEDYVYVTIADENGSLAIADEAIEISDVDGDGSVTINDALIAAHESYYEGGAESGYESVEGDYGLMLAKLWGVENGGSYGYYVNNASAFSLADPINAGDHLNAFIYTDLTSWSDTYCYFDKNDETISGNTNEVPTVELTLSAAAFDADWNPITVPVEGAIITIDGEKTDAVTDADGKATVELPSNEGTFTYTISAVSDTQVLVPPVCKITSIQTAEPAAENSAVDSAVTVTAGDTTVQTESGSKGSPDTGITDVAAIAGIAIVASGVVVISKRRK